jgi:single-strand DNA-binding protein
MQLQGMLKSKSQTQQVSDKFKKREFVLTTDFDGTYPQHILIQTTQDKCALLDSFNEGDLLTVDINIKGREWNGGDGVKYFNSIEAWKITKN